MTTLARLQAADPVTWLRNETDVDAPPPADVLARIVAIPPPEPPRRRRRLALIAVPVAAVAAALLLWLLPSSSDRVDLAAKAYATTAPSDAVTYAETTLERALSGAGAESRSDRIRDRIWQFGERSHRYSTIVNLTGPDAGRRWDYEYDIKDNTERILNPDGTVDTIRHDDASYNAEERRALFDNDHLTFVDRFRQRYASAQLRDAGEATFAGQRAHAYDVIEVPQPAGRKLKDATYDRETFYLDPDSGMPLGSVKVLRGYGTEQVDRRTLRPKPGAVKDVEHRFTETLDRYERLPVTPENLAKLDAPAIDAGKPRLGSGR